jgi:mRNA interferase HigB
VEIVGLELIVEFSKQHARARKSLQKWVQVVQGADWNTLINVKQTFGSVDYKSDKYIFNIKGNDYRLIAEIIFTVWTVFILDVKTHAEYSKLTL